MIIEINNLKKSYKTEIIKGLDLSIEAPMIIGISGPSGIGKTTLLNTLAGFEKVTSGEIKIHDQVVANGKVHLEPYDRMLGYMFQEACLWPHMTVRENILYGNHEIIDNDLLRQLHLEGLLNKYPHEISGGESKRVSLMRALHAKKEIILMDEPFAYLDEELILELIQIIRDIFIKTRKTMIIVSHQKNYLLDLVDYHYVLRAGVLNA